MSDVKSWEKITKIGKYIQKTWDQLFKRYKINAKINGIPALSSFTFDHHENVKFKTFITQEMLKNDILASNTIYPCILHNEKNLTKYFEVLEKNLKIISSCFDGNNIDNYLKFGVSSGQIKRLN